MTDKVSVTIDVTFTTNVEETLEISREVYEQITNPELHYFEIIGILYDNGIDLDEKARNQELEIDDLEICLEDEE
ncbi:hypothetical protein KKJ06_16640 [Xenorhabdus bovienii]|uniref:hypothetical protein n=1 Tax=Xenorhabdus bovienii TaxID=40576 RepID=UPI0023B2DA2E|nr:hypothetical protein [Xenorhabdus bovienii]MDE9557008.1 hypothetical protein [Xenorhabdus bovienii]